jgi:hypothetical protein
MIWLISVILLSFLAGAAASIWIIKDALILPPW